jgi:hypothetical protein
MLGVHKWIKIKWYLVLFGCIGGVGECRIVHLDSHTQNNNPSYIIDFKSMFFIKKFFLKFQVCDVAQVATIHKK